MVTSILSWQLIIETAGEWSTDEGPCAHIFAVFSSSDFYFWAAQAATLETKLADTQILPLW